MSNFSLNRRSLCIGAVASSISAPFVSGARAQSRELIFNGGGGASQEAMFRSIREPFGNQNGVKVIDTFPFDLGKLSTMVRTKTTAWDVTDIPSAQVGVAIERGLLEPIDYSMVERAGLPDDVFGEYTIKYGYVSSNIVYNKSRIKPEAAPTDWASFWDQKRFPGPRTLRKTPAVTLEYALLADGVPIDALYPLDIDRAFRKMDEIKPYVRWWTTGGNSMDLLTKGEADIGTTFSNRAIVAQKDGFPLEVVYNQGALTGLYYAVPKGARNRQDAMRLLNHVIQAEAQAVMAEVSRYSPVNPKAFALIKPETAAELATSPANAKNVFRVDELGYWRTNLEEITRRFDAWQVGR